MLFYSQVSDSELSKMTSLSSIQTKGLKRQFAEEEWMAKMTDAGTEIEKVIVNKEYGELSIQQNTKCWIHNIDLHIWLIFLLTWIFLHDYKNFKFFVYFAW